MSQKITYAHIKNFKGIKDIEVTDLSRFVAIFGLNGAGKTSFIDGIRSAIKLEKGGNDKVRVGEENGEIEVHFDDFKIKRIIGKNGKLEVEHNGELVSKPQSRLDGVFMGTIGDPQKFLTLRNKEKIRYILETHGKKEEYDKLEAERQPLFDQRTELHRTVLAKEEEVKQTDVSTFSVLDTQDDLFDIDSLQKELQEKQDHNRSLDVLKNRKVKGQEYLDGLNLSDTNLLSEISSIEDQIKKLQEARDEKKKLQVQNGENKKKATAELEVIEKEINDFVEYDTKEIYDKISNYGDEQESVAKIRALKGIYDDNVVRAENLRTDWKNIDTQIKGIEKQQNSLIESIDISYKMKIEDGVMFVEDGDVRVALDDLNTASQLDLGVDICLNGPNEIKIITIENANSLDPNTMKKIKDKIEKKNGQCFLETVYKTGYESITIEDGEMLAP